MVKLQVYINQDCWACIESRSIVAEIMPGFPGLKAELLDLSSCEVPDYVFAVPTFVLNGRIISLGNPYPDELRQRIQETLENFAM